MMWKEEAELNTACGGKDIDRIDTSGDGSK